MSGASATWLFCEARAKNEGEAEWEVKRKNESRQFQQPRTSPSLAAVVPAPNHWPLTPDHWPLIFYLFPLDGLKCMSKE